VLKGLLTQEGLNLYQYPNMMKRASCVSIVVHFHADFTERFIEQRRQEVKGELKARKIRVAELEALLRAETQKLEHSQCFLLSSLREPQGSDFAMDQPSLNGKLRLHMLPNYYEIVRRWNWISLSSNRNDPMLM
jgi:hypothetical protein